MKSQRRYFLFHCNNNASLHGCDTRCRLNPTQLFSGRCLVTGGHVSQQHRQTTTKLQKVHCRRASLSPAASRETVITAISLSSCSYRVFSRCDSKIKYSWHDASSSFSAVTFIEMNNVDLLSLKTKPIKFCFLIFLPFGGFSLLPFFITIISQLSTCLICYAAIREAVMILTATLNEYVGKIYFKCFFLSKNKL